MRPPPAPRLLYLTNSDWIGGMERSVINLSRELTDRGWAVRSVFLETPRTPALLAWARTLGFPAESSPALLSYFERHTYRKMFALSRLVARTRANVVHLHVGSNFLPLKDVLAIRLSGRRTCVASIHSAEPWTRENRNARRKTRAAAALCQLLIVHSSATRQVLLDAGVPERKIRFIPLGLRVPEAPPARDAARGRLRIAASAFVVTTNARLEPHKGVADLIAALAQLPDPESIVLLIAGDGPQRQDLERLAAMLLPGRVRFLGHVLDHADLYAATDVFAMPTRNAKESFGLVFIEAAFHGVPSVGTRVGGVPDAIVDEHTGLLVTPNAPAELAGALGRLRGDPTLRTRLGLAAQARAQELFTVGLMADRYEDAYLAVAPRPLRRRATATT